MTCAPSALIAVLTALVLVALSCCMCCPCAGAFQLPPLQRLSLSQQRITRHTLPIAAKLVERGLAWHGGCWTCALSTRSSSGRKGSIIRSSSISVNSSCMHCCNSCRRISYRVNMEDTRALQVRWPRSIMSKLLADRETVLSAVINQIIACAHPMCATPAVHTYALVNALRCITRNTSIEPYMRRAIFEICSTTRGNQRSTSLYIGFPSLKG